MGRGGNEAGICFYLGHPWDTFSCPNPEKLSFWSFCWFSRPRSRFHVLSDSRTVFHVLLAELRSHCVQITFKLRSITFKLRKNYVQSYHLKALHEKSSRTTILVQLSKSLLFLIWTGKGVLGMPQVHILYRLLSC